MCRSNSGDKGGGEGGHSAQSGQWNSEKTWQNHQVFDSGVTGTHAERAGGVLTPVTEAEETPP